MLSFRTLLQFTKKRRRRNDSGSDLDIDATPPPSPKEEDPSIEKRRSGRNTKRKKYVDEIDLNLSEEENILSQLPPDVAAEIKGGDTNGGTETPTNANSATPSAPQTSAENSELPPAEPQATPSGPNYAFVVSDWFRGEAFNPLRFGE